MPKLSEEFTQWRNNPEYFDRATIMNKVSAALKAIEDEPVNVNERRNYIATREAMSVRIRELEAQQPPFHPTYVQTLQERIAELEADNIHIADSAGKAYVKISELEAREKLMAEGSGEAWGSNFKLRERIAELEADNAKLDRQVSEHYLELVKHKKWVEDSRNVMIAIDRLIDLEIG